MVDVKNVSYKKIMSLRRIDTLLSFILSSGSKLNCDCLGKQGGLYRGLDGHGHGID